jgi:hypothetical protein
MCKNPLTQRECLINLRLHLRFAAAAAIFLCRDRVSLVYVIRAKLNKGWSEICAHPRGKSKLKEQVHQCIRRESIGVKSSHRGVNRVASSAIPADPISIEKAMSLSSLINRTDYQK